MPLISKAKLNRMVPGSTKSLPHALEWLGQVRTKSFLSAKRFDIFLSHAFEDARDILTLYDALTMVGYEVFVDWIADPDTDRAEVTKETAEGLRDVMQRSNSLLFAVSSNSGESKWMPWELGYSDGLHGKVAVLPITEDETNLETYTADQQYLRLYPYVTLNPNTQGQAQLWVSEAIDTFVSLNDWLEGGKPTRKSLFTVALREQGIISNPKDA
jgi:TIR domain-containing protein